MPLVGLNKDWVNTVSTISAIPDEGEGRYPIVHGEFGMRMIEDEITPVITLTTIVPEGPEKDALLEKAESFKFHILMEYAKHLKRVIFIDWYKDSKKLRLFIPVELKHNRAFSIDYAPFLETKKILKNSTSNLGSC